MSAWTLAWLEFPIPTECHATISIKLDRDGPAEEEVRQRLRESGLRITASRVWFANLRQQREFLFDVKLFGDGSESESPASVKALAAQSDIIKVQWESNG